MDLQVTLKRARDLMKATLEASNSIKIERSVRLSVYTERDIEEIITEAVSHAEENVSDTIELITVHYAIKRLVGETNDKVGITALLRDDAHNTEITKKLHTIQSQLNSRDESIYARLEKVMTHDDIAAIKQRLKVTRERIETKDNANVEDFFSVSVATDKFIDHLKDEVLRLKRQKAGIQDSIAALNVTHSITLDDASVAVLRKHKIL